MNPRRWLYRARQFFSALRDAPAPTDLELARETLNPACFALFVKLQPSEQAHSLQIFHGLRAQGENDPHLLGAALLHDIGKNRYPLFLWERVANVLVAAFFPDLARRWGQGEPTGWKKAFVVAARHPAWGAEMAAGAGASPLTVELIRLHQSMITAGLPIPIQALLPKLQALDNTN